MQGRGKLTTRLSAALALCAAGFACGCAQQRGDFPAILESPAPRSDTPLSPDQVKQTTENLLSERDRLCAEARTNSSNNAPGSAPPSCGVTSVSATGSVQAAGTGGKP